jgi:hypothetical protein
MLLFKSWGGWKIDNGGSSYIISGIVGGCGSVRDDNYEKIKFCNLENGVLLIEDI